MKNRILVAVLGFALLYSIGLELAGGLGLAAWDQWGHPRVELYKAQMTPPNAGNHKPGKPQKIDRPIVNPE